MNSNSERTFLGVHFDICSTAIHRKEVLQIGQIFKNLHWKRRKNPMTRKDHTIYKGQAGVGYDTLHFVLDKLREDKNAKKSLGHIVARLLRVAEELQART